MCWMMACYFSKVPRWIKFHCSIRHCKKCVYLRIQGRRVRNILESHLSRSAKNFAIRRPIFKLRYLSNQLRYKKGTYIFWKFRNLSFIWLWFHAIISICIGSVQFWKKGSKIMGFCRLQKLPIFSIFCHFEKMLDFERL